MPARPFPDTLRQIRYGALQDELTEALNALVAECTKTNKTGELVLKIKLKPNPAGQVEVLDDLTVKLPKPVRGTSIFFATPEGNLMRDDPRQQQLEGLRVAEKDTGDVRDVRSA